MRQTELNRLGVESFQKPQMRALRLAAVLLGVGIVFAAGPLHAGDDDDEDAPQKSFERGILDNVMSSIGGKRIEDGTIDYRERSPLVIPSKTNTLPPPQTAKAKLAPNWPKDPDEAERKRAREEAAKPALSPEEASRPLMPSELATRTPKSRRDTAASASGNNSRSETPIMLMPSQLGYNGGMFSNAFGGDKQETAKFTGEPTRSDLTDPPTGYQTPSPNFAYGAGPSKGTETVCDSASGQCEKRDIK